MSRLIKPVRIPCRAIRRHFRCLKEPPCRERNRNRIRLFSRVAITSGFCNFVSRASYFVSRVELHNVARSRLHFARRHFSLFIFVSPSLGVPLPIASRSPSHLCHPCIVFTSRAAYIILNVGRPRQPSDTFPSFCRTSSTSSSRAPPRNLPRENSLAMQFE